MYLQEAIDMLEKYGFDINSTTDKGDELDQIPYYENERFGAWAAKEGIDIYLSNDELCKKKYEEYKKLVRAKRDFE